MVHSSRWNMQDSVDITSSAPGRLRILNSFCRVASSYLYLSLVFYREYKSLISAKLCRKRKASKLSQADVLRIWTDGSGSGVRVRRDSWTRVLDLNLICRDLFSPNWSHSVRQDHPHVDHCDSLFWNLLPIRRVHRSWADVLWRQRRMNGKGRHCVIIAS